MVDAIRVSPFAVSHKLSCDLEGTEAADWAGKTYVPVDQTIKHRSVLQRYVEGRRWADTELFTQIYPRRLANGEKLRGCTTIDALAEHYTRCKDALFADLRRHGFREMVDGAPTSIAVLLDPRGRLVIGNNGNHRLAMAKALELDSILVRVQGELKDVACDFEPVTFHPLLHEGARDIPAMTTPAERLAYYELALKAAPHGAVVELGTWLGAATVFIAAGLRDAGVTSRMHAYDRFEWQAIHDYKAGAPLTQPMYSQFKDNLGPLEALVEIHRGEISAAKWQDGPISLLIADGPKRVPDIVRTLQQFGRHIPVGGHMAWQDFAYFPAYDIPACLDPLEQAGCIEFVDSVYPGTTAVFRVTGELDLTAIRPLTHWSPHHIVETWDRWRDRLQPGMRPRWMCGAAMFLCDRGAPKEGARLFRALLADYRDELAPKWQYFKEKRPKVAAKYSVLVDVFDAA